MPDDRGPLRVGQFVEGLVAEPGGGRKLPRPVVGLVRVLLNP